MPMPMPVSMSAGKTAQDQVRVIKQILSELLPGIRVWLDVDGESCAPLPDGTATPLASADASQNVPTRRL